MRRAAGNDKTKQNKKRRRIKGKYPSCWLYVTASVLGTTVPACHFVRAFLPLYVSCCRCFLVDIFCPFFLFSFRWSNTDATPQKKYGPRFEIEKNVSSFAILSVDMKRLDENEEERQSIIRKRKSFCGWASFFLLPGVAGESRPSKLDCGTSISGWVVQRSGKMGAAAAMPLAKAESSTPSQNR